MSPRDMFIKYLVTNGYIEEDLLEQASKQQAQQGGELLDILLDMLMHQREQTQFIEELSQNNPVGKRIGYISSAENQIPSLLQKFLEFSKQQETGQDSNELVPTAALEAPELSSLPQASSSSPVYYSSSQHSSSLSSPRSDVRAKQSHYDLNLSPSQESSSPQGRATQEYGRSVQSSTTLGFSTKSKLSTTVCQESWKQTKLETSEYPLDDELLRYADAFQTLCDPHIPHFLTENQKENSAEDQEGYVSVVGIEVPGDDAEEVIDDIADFLEEVHASSEKLLASDYAMDSSVSYHEMNIAPPSPSGLYDLDDPYTPGVPRSIGTPSQASHLALPAPPEPEPRDQFIPYRINGSQDSLEALPAMPDHGPKEPNHGYQSQGSLPGVSQSHSSLSALSHSSLSAISNGSLPAPPQQSRSHSSLSAVSNGSLPAPPQQSRSHSSLSAVSNGSLSALPQVKSNRSSHNTSQSRSYSSLSAVSNGSLSALPQAKSHSSLSALPQAKSHSSLSALPRVRSNSSLHDISQSRSRLSLDQIPVASPRVYPVGPSSPSYQSVHELSAHRGHKLRKSVISRDALLASASSEALAKAPDKWTSADELLSASNEPRDSSHDLRTFSSYEMFAPSQPKMSMPSREINTPSHTHLTSLSHNSLPGVSYRNISAVSHKSIPSMGSASYKIAPVVASTDDMPSHPHEPIKTESTREEGTNWKWLSFFLLSLLALTALVGSALSYHKFIKKSVDSSAPIKRPTSPK